MPTVMRRSTGWGIATVLTAAGLAAGCSGGGSTSAGSTTQHTDTTTTEPAIANTPTPVPVTSTSTAPPPLSADDYKKVLQGVNAALAPDFAAVGKAKGGTDISAALAKLSADATDQLGKIPDNPPADAVTVSGELTDALKDLSGAADSEKSDAGSKVCAGGSAAAELSRSDGANHLRTAVQHLGAANPAYGNIVTFLPAPIQDQNRRLDSGTVLRRSSGPGKLTIHTADEDAVITLTKTGSKTPIASVYVRSNSTTDLKNVPGATFEAYISYGADWDGTAHAFTRDCAFSKTDQTFDFSDADWELTLYKVANGNMKEIPVDPNQAPPP